MHLSLEAFKKAGRRRADRTNTPLNTALADLSADFGFRNFDHAQKCLRGASLAAPGDVSTTQAPSYDASTIGLIFGPSLVIDAQDIAAKLSPNFWQSSATDIVLTVESLMVRGSGENGNWQEKARFLWRSVSVAMCYLRDTKSVELSASKVIEYLGLDKLGELYVLGHQSAWPSALVGIRSYLDTGLPAYSVERLMAKHGYEPEIASAPHRQSAPMPTKQDGMAVEQHDYRTCHLMPALLLLQETERSRSGG